jgi:hypothetical protein
MRYLFYRYTCSCLSRKYKHKTIDAYGQHAALEDIDDILSMLPKIEITGSRGRSNADATISRVSELTGLSQYHLQRASTNHQGTHEFHTPGDLRYPLASFTPTEGDMLVFRDTDYYIESLPSILATFPTLTAIYTYIPENAGQTSEHLTFCFRLKHGVMIMDSNVRDSHYEHPLWDWTGKQVLAFTTWDHHPRAALYDIHRVRVAPHRYVVFLLPRRTWAGFAAHFVREFAVPLERLNYIQTVGEQHFVRVKYNDGKKVMVSTAPLGSSFSATTSVQVDSQVAVAGRTTNSRLSIPYVTTFTEGSKQEASMLLEFHQAKGDSTRAPLIVAPEDGIIRVQYEPGSYDPDAKASLQAYMSPFIRGAFAFDVAKSSDQQMVAGRVLSIASGHIPLRATTSTYINEFLKMLVPRKPKLQFASIDAVREKQNRRTQLNIIAQAEEEGDYVEDVNKVFMKKEAYVKVTDPRAISTLPPGVKLAYSRAMLAIARWVKTKLDTEFTWYGFSRTPKRMAMHIATRLAKEKPLWVLLTDLSRWDGRLSSIFRVLEERFLLRVIADEHHGDIKRLHRLQYKVMCRTKMGVFYKTDYQRLSGSPETSLLNSIDNAFLAYYTLRRMGRSSEQAFARIGFCGGDDGLSFEIPAATYNKCAAELGHKAEAVEVRRGDRGVEFLARRYGPGVWYGDPTSMCQLYRQLSKFHTSRPLPPQVTPEEKLIAKAYSYFLTDHDTPVIGQYVSRVMKLAGRGIKDTVARILNKDHEFIHYNTVKYDEDEQAPNDGQPWMLDELREQLPEFDLIKFDNWLASLQTVTDALKPPLMMDIPEKFDKAIPPAPAVVDGTTTKNPPASKDSSVPPKGTAKVGNRSRNKDKSKTSSRSKPTARSKQQSRAPGKSWRPKK